MDLVRSQGKCSCTTYKAYLTTSVDTCFSFFLLPNKRMYYKLNSLLISPFIVTYLSLIKIKTHVNVAKVESMNVELGKKNCFCQPLCQELSKQNQHRIYL